MIELEQQSLNKIIPYLNLGSNDGVRCTNRGSAGDWSHRGDCNEGYVCTQEGDCVKQGNRTMH